MSQEKLNGFSTTDFISYPKKYQKDFGNISEKLYNDPSLVRTNDEYGWRPNGVAEKAKYWKGKKSDE